MKDWETGVVGETGEIIALFSHNLVVSSTRLPIFPTFLTSIEKDFIESKKDNIIAPVPVSVDRKLFDAPR